MRFLLEEALYQVSGSLPFPVAYQMLFRSDNIRSDIFHVQKYRQLPASPGEYM